VSTAESSYDRVQRRCMEILDRGKVDDKTSRYADNFLAILILANVIAVSLESVEALAVRYENFFLLFENVSTVIFSVEYLLRLWSNAARADSKYTSSLGRRLQYVFSFNGLVDLFAVLPSVISFFVGDLDLRWLRVIRLLRLFKISNYSSALEDLMSAVYQERQSFMAALYIFTIALFMASALMYLVEQDAQPDKFSSIPESMWWALITLTTVGYGDVSPITPLGKIIGAITAIMGVSTVALLTGILANAFANQVSSKRAIFEAEVASALSDGFIDEEETGKIEALRERFNFSEAHARAVIETLEKSKNIHPS
jgi:voltage-gated potassium channel